MIVYCSTDLIFVTKISGTADALKIPARPARTAEMLASRLNRVEDGRANDPVTGVLIDLEMGDVGLALLDQVKKHDPKIPVVAYGSHVAVEVLQAAKARGADVVMPRGMFSVQLPQILQRYGGTEV